MEGLNKAQNGAAMLFCSIVFSFVLTGTVQNAYGADQEAVSGKKIYEERCQICHGEKGDGKGLANNMRKMEKNGRILKVTPRDFTRSVFRFRSTATGCMPADADLLRLVDVGITRSFMPGHKDELKPEEKKAVI